MQTMNQIEKMVGTPWNRLTSGTTVRRRRTSPEEETVKEREDKEQKVQLQGREMDELYKDIEETTLEHGVKKQKNMFVYVHCNSKLQNGQKAWSVYKIHIGRGKQSFRWLGMAAAQRYGQEIKSTFGKLRQREADAPRMLIAHVPPRSMGARTRSSPSPKDETAGCTGPGRSRLLRVRPFRDAGAYKSV